MPSETTINRSAKDIPFGEARIGSFNYLGLWTLCSKEVRRFMKVWQQTMAAPAMTTLLFMVIFTLALRGRGEMIEGMSYATFLAPGLMVMAILQNAFGNTSSSMIIAKVQGNIVDTLMPPLSAGELTIGFMVGGMVRGILVGCSVLLAFIGLSFFTDLTISIHSFIPILYFGLVGSILLSLLGLLTGIWAEKFDHSSTITNFIVVPLSLLSGTFYTVDRLPESWQIVSTANPFYYIIDGFRYGFLGHHDSDLTIGVAYSFVLTAAMWVFVHRVLKSGWRLKT